VQVPEDGLGDLGLLLGRGPAELVEGNVEPVVDARVEGVVLVANLLSKKTVWLRGVCFLGSQGTKLIRGMAIIFY
jgi:hypothetical protein